MERLPALPQKAWPGLKTNHLRELIEATLAHAVRNRVNAPYARSDLFDRRRVLMDDGARYLAQGIGGPHQAKKRQVLIQPAPAGVFIPQRLEARSSPRWLLGGST